MSKGKAAPGGKAAPRRTPWQTIAVSLGGATLATTGFVAIPLRVPDAALSALLTAAGVVSAFTISAKSILISMCSTTPPPAFAVRLVRARRFDEMIDRFRDASYAALFAMVVSTAAAFVRPNLPEPHSEETTEWIYAFAFFFWSLANIAMFASLLDLSLLLGAVLRDVGRTMQDWVDERDKKASAEADAAIESLIRSATEGAEQEQLAPAQDDEEA